MDPWSYGAENPINQSIRYVVKLRAELGLLQRQEHSGLHHWVGFTCEGEVVTQAGDKWGKERINYLLSSSNDQPSRDERLVRRISISSR
jgi:hypothetical protein